MRTISDNSAALMGGAAVAHAGPSAERGEVRPRAPRQVACAPAAVWSPRTPARSARRPQGEDGGSEARASSERSEDQLLSIRAGYFYVVVLSDDVDAFAGAFLGRVDDLEAQVGGHVGDAAGRELELARPVLDVRQAVDVELENLGGVLNTEAVTSTEILVHPHP